jgi:endoribonuclease LACTB2
VQGIPQVTKLCPQATFSKFSVNGEGEYLPIRDGDEFAVEGAKITALHTPGHTTDHTVFWMEDSNALFTGDSILGQGTAVFENLTTYLSSLKKQLNLKPTTLYPGHGPVIQGKEATEKIQEYINHRQQREDEIIKVMMDAEGEVTAMDIVKVIYARYPQSLWAAAERGVILHLEKLRDEGKAKESGGKWTLISRQSSL